MAILLHRLGWSVGITCLLKTAANPALEGITIAQGTDGNTPWALHSEMADMVMDRP
jgi:hypothetical protein